MGFQFNPITGNLDLVGSGGGGGNPFNQDLNTTDSVTFVGVTGTGQFSFQNGNYYSSTDGTGNFLTLKNDSYYQLQFMRVGAGSYWNIGAYHPQGMFQIANSAAGLAFQIFDGTSAGYDAKVSFYSGNATIDPSGNSTFASLSVAGNAAIDNSGVASFTGLTVNGSSVALLTETQTFTNKTLRAPVISNGTTSTILTADAANILSVANSTSASGLRVFNTRTDASNYERAILDWTTNANILTIGTQNAGTGTARRLRLQSAESIDFFTGNTNRPMNMTSQAVNIYLSTNFAWYTGAGDPTTSSNPWVGGSGTCAVYKNTTTGVVSLWVRDGSTMKKVALA